MRYAAKPAVWFPAIRAGSGSDIFTERLAEGLCRRGFRAQITWMPLRAEYAPWAVAKLSPPAWANIAHVNTWLPLKFIPKGLPFIATMHLCVHDPTLAPYKNRAQSLYHRIWVRRIEQNVLNAAKRVIAVSHYTAKHTKAAYHHPDIKVIHNGIDLSSIFHPSGDTKPRHPFRLLYAGNWSSRKGTDLLAPIMTMLGTNFQLYYTAGRAADIQLLKLLPNARTLGRLTTPKAMAHAYRNADALLFPTRLEGFGLVALEAQACGLPVIATRGSALPEVIVDGKTGLLCPQDDVAAFAAAARKLADVPTLWQRMSKAARTHAESHFSFRTMVDRYLAVYFEVLATSHPGGKGR